MEYFVWDIKSGCQISQSILFEKKESSSKFQKIFLGVRKEWSCKIHIAICVMKWGHPVKYHRVTCVKQAISNKISHSILCERQKSSYKTHIVICVIKCGQAVKSHRVYCVKKESSSKISQSFLCYYVRKVSQAESSHKISFVKKWSIA